MARTNPGVTDHEDCSQTPRKTRMDPCKHLRKRKAPTTRMDHPYPDLHNTPDEPSRPMQCNHQ
ncbi:unnamed protein product [Arctogadus glacialis]